MIYCSQPRALKSTATPSTGEGAREVENGRQKEAKESKRKGKEGNDNNKRCVLLPDSRQGVRRGKTEADATLGESGVKAVRRGRKVEEKAWWGGWKMEVVKGIRRGSRRKEGRPVKKRGKDITTQGEGVIAELLGERKQGDWMKMRGERSEREK